MAKYMWTGSYTAEGIKGVIAEGGYEECLNHPEVRRSYWQIDDSATEAGATHG